MCGEQHGGGGRLVDLARFDAHQAIFDGVDAPDAVLSGLVIEVFDQFHALDFFAVECGRCALLKRDLHVARLAWRGGRLPPDK